jgi:hypothetical protein
MALDKAIAHGKEKRRRYYRSKAFDTTCRPHGSCPHCRGSRLHSDRKARQIATEKLAEFLRLKWNEEEGQNSNH